MKAKVVRIGSTVFVLLAVAFFVAPKPAYAAICTSTATGTNWSNNTHWTGCSGLVPQNGDTVIIATATTVDTATNSLASLTINSGQTLTVAQDVNVNFDSSADLTVNGTLSYNNNQNRAVTVVRDVIVASGASLTTTDANGNNTHSLIIGRNLTNNGTLNLINNNDVVNVTFNGTANQTVSGNGATTAFNNITINNSGGASNNIVDITSTNFTAATGFLTLTNGVFKLSTAATITPSTGSLALGATVGIIVNNTGAVVNVGTALNVNGGNLELLTGTINTGTGNNVFGVSSGSAKLSGGTLNVNGSFSMSGGTTTINGATINIDAQVTNNLGATTPIFEAQGNSNLTFASGTVIIVDPHATAGTGNAIQIVSGTGTKNFAGSTFQLGNGSSTTSGSADGFDVNCGSGLMLGNLVANNPSGTNRHVRLVTNNCTLGGNLMITAGEFQLNGQNLTLAGNFTNNGTFTPGVNTVTFNGSVAQTISGSSATVFNNLTINNANGVTLNANETVNGALVLTAGDLTAGTSTNQLTLGCSATVSSAGSGDVIGDVVRTCAFGTVNTYAFNNPNTSLKFDSGAPPASVTINLVKTKPTEFTTAVPRTYTISSSGGGSFSVTLRLRYASTELTGMAEGNLRLWRYDNVSRFVLQGGLQNNGDGTNRYVSLGGVTQFSRWGITDNGSPTAVTLSSFNASSEQSSQAPWAFGGAGILLVGIGGIIARCYRMRPKA